MTFCRGSPLSGHSARTAAVVCALAMLFGAAMVAFTPESSGAALSDGPNGSASFPTPIRHVFVIQLENQELSTVLAQGPYQASLYSQYAGASHYYGVCHPSASNYLAATAGQPFQCGSDAVTTYSAANIADLLSAKGESWVGYMETMPSACYTSNSGGYIAHHDPFIYYKDIVGNRTLCDSHVLPLSSFDPSKAPANFVWVTPDGADNGHLSVSSGDTWLKGFLSPLLAESWASSTVFVVQYDEGTFPNGTDDPSGYNGLSGGHIFFTAVSPYSKGVGVYGADASSYNLLATTEWLLGLGNLGEHDASPSFPAMKSLFQFGSVVSGTHTVTFTETGLPAGTTLSPPAPSVPHLVVELLAGDSSEVKNVISLAPYLLPGDDVDVYNFVPNGTVNPPLVNSVAASIRAAVAAGVNISANTGLISNVQELLASHPTNLNAVAATYEPFGVTGEGTYNFSVALQYFTELNQIDHAAGLTSVAYISGHPLLAPALQIYGWNYAVLAQTTDRVWVETQDYAFEAATNLSVWNSALSALVAQFASAGEPLTSLAVQIDLGNNTIGNDPQGWGVDPATCLREMRTALTYGVDTIYLWTARGAEVYLSDLLHNLTRSTSGATLNSTGAAPVAVNWSVTLNGSTQTSGSSEISFSEPTGNYSFRVVSPLSSPNGTRYVASPSSGTIAVIGANVSVAIDFGTQYRVLGSASPRYGGSVSPSSGWYAPDRTVSLLATPASGYSFSRWMGDGPGNYSGTADPVSVTVAGPINETAEFVPLSANLVTVYFNETGLPAGIAWNVTFNGLALNSSKPSIDYRVPNGTYEYVIASPVRGALTGVRYVTATPSGSIVVGTSSVAVGVRFSAEYNLSLSVSPGGSVTVAPGGGWYAAGASVNLTAVPAHGFQFAGWVGSGTGSYTGNNSSARLTIVCPVAELANFAAVTASFTLSVRASGLPSGMNWSVNIGGLNVSTDGTTITVALSQSTIDYTVQSPIFVSPSIRYTAVPSSGRVNLSTPSGNVSVVFVPQALIKASAEGPGSVALVPASDGWYTLGTDLEFHATERPGAVFLGWTGVGNGSYTGLSNPASVEISGTVLEVAHFAPANLLPPGSGGAPGGSINPWSSLTGSALLAAGILGVAFAMNAIVRFASRGHRRSGS